MVVTEVQAQAKTQQERVQETGEVMVMAEVQAQAKTIGWDSTANRRDDGGDGDTGLGESHSRRGDGGGGGTGIGKRHSSGQYSKQERRQWWWRYRLRRKSYQGTIQQIGEAMVVVEVQAQEKAQLICYKVCMCSENNNRRAEEMQLNLVNVTFEGRIDLHLHFL